MKSDISRYARALAFDAGFNKIGIAQACRLNKSVHLSKWLEMGFHGTMLWMEEYLEKRLDIGKLYPEARSVLVVAHNYFTPEQHRAENNYAKISRYAWGKDYHKIIKKKLKQILINLKDKYPDTDGRIYVDTAPIQDKLWAEAAGIGWQGKNTNIITRELGSWFFIGELALNVELVYDLPSKNYCGSCKACIDACPTNALQPYVLDARKCISYLTIEYRNAPIPKNLAPKMQNWIFGCDICQEVCPWNKFQQISKEENYQPDKRNVAPTFAELSRIDEVEFRDRFNKSPINRLNYPDFKRNINAARTGENK